VRFLGISFGFGSMSKPNREAKNQMLSSPQNKKPTTVDPYSTYPFLLASHFLLHPTNPPQTFVGDGGLDPWW
jgi:hypothetical protein